ncbi:MAG: vitamin K epoxide reductase family protein [Patescibacteria group bacterium]|nr:vitamin K epoxide reductase family protein [Patescibacteria group bacterium]
MRLTRNNLSITCLILAFIGFLDATYLTILHYQNAFPPCTVTGGCEAVLTSQYSIILGVPISLFGALFYLIIMTFSLAILLHKRKIYAHGLFLAAISGLFASAVLFFVQFFILKSFCQYCLLSEIISLAIFIVCSFLYSKFLRS